MAVSMALCFGCGFYLKTREDKLEEQHQFELVEEAQTVFENQRGQEVEMTSINWVESWVNQKEEQVSWWELSRYQIDS